MGPFYTFGSVELRILTTWIWRTVLNIWIPRAFERAVLHNWIFRTVRSKPLDRSTHLDLQNGPFCRFGSLERHVLSFIQAVLNIRIFRMARSKHLDLYLQNGVFLEQPVRNIWIFRMARSKHLDLHLQNGMFLEQPVRSKHSRLQNCNKRIFRTARSKHLDLYSGPF